MYTATFEFRITVTLVRGLVGRSLEVDYTVGKHGGFVSMGWRYKMYGGKPWLTGMLGKHMFNWR